MSTQKDKKVTFAYVSFERICYRIQWNVFWGKFLYSSQNFEHSYRAENLAERGLFFLRYASMTVKTRCTAVMKIPKAGRASTVDTFSQNPKQCSL